jgi:hypothetical protein
MDTAMAASNSISAFATVLASLGTLFYTIMGFTQASAPNQVSMLNSGEGFVGYAVMAWLGIVFLAFGWAGAAYSIVKKHFGLALTGACLIVTSCPVEYALLTHAPHSAIVAPLVYTWGGKIIMQALFAFAGVFFIVKAKHQFT